MFWKRKYEYYVVHQPGLLNYADLMKLGKDGWRLVQIVLNTANGNYVYYFEKAI